MNRIDPGKPFLEEECFFDHARILEMLATIDAFRSDASSATCRLTIDQAFDHQTKGLHPKVFPLEKGQVVLIEGKYATTETFQRYFDLRYRVLVDPDLAEARFQIRSRNWSPDDAETQVLFYPLALVPSYKRYAERTLAAIKSFIDLGGDDWSLRPNNPLMAGSAPKEG